jgi:hypothetical protein
VFEALLAILTVPVKLPVVVGANLMLRLADPPAAMVIGKLAPTRLKPVPLTVAPDTERLDPPVFDNVSVCVEVLFAAMLLKLIVVGETAIWAAAVATETVADADFVESATLVAFTV